MKAIGFAILSFAIFNFADICAVLGGIVFAVMMIIGEHKEEKATNSNENKIKVINGLKSQKI